MLKIHVSVLILTILIPESVHNYDCNCYIFIWEIEELSLLITLSSVLDLGLHA